MKINTNLQIHVFFKASMDDVSYRAYANELAKVLDPLEKPWLLADVGLDRLIAYLNVDPTEAIIIPATPHLEHVRVFHHLSTITAREPFISSGGQ